MIFCIFFESEENLKQIDVRENYTLKYFIINFNTSDKYAICFVISN